MNSFLPGLLDDWEDGFKAHRFCRFLIDVVVRSNRKRNVRVGAPEGLEAR